MGEPIEGARRRATVLEAAVRAAYDEATRDPVVEGEVASLGYLLSQAADHRSRADRLAEGAETTMDPMVLLARRRARGRNSP